MDPLLVMIIRGALEQVTDEMDASLFRASLSTVISEGHDASHGIYDRETGATLVQGKQGLPIFVGTMQSAVRAVIDEFGSSVRPGDTFIFNDPYLGGTHLQDAKVVRPVFIDDQVFCYVASDAHLADIGGPVPGGFNASAKSYFQEGFFLGPVHLSTEDVINEEVLKILGWNTRLPEWTMADVVTQYQTLRRGETRLREIVERYGAATVRGVMEELCDRADQVMRSHIAQIPDGEYSCEDFIDNDGQSAGRPLRVAVDLTVHGPTMTIDFSRTHPAATGPLNISRPTLNAACYVALKHIFPDVIANAGCLRPVTIRVPDRTMLTVMAPSPVGGYLEVTTRVIDVLFGALAQADPDLSYAASYGSVNTLAIAGQRSDTSTFVMFTWFGGGLGASSKGDGLNHGPGPISTAILQPMEILESRYPVVFEEYALRPDSAGKGKFRGGLGSVYRVRVDAECEVSIMGDRGKFPPFGINGGEPAALNRIGFYRTKGEVDRPTMVSKCTGVPLQPGDCIVIESPGGGGYGNHSERDPQLLQQDRRLGYISPEVGS